MDRIRQIFQDTERAIEEVKTDLRELQSYASDEDKPKRKGLATITGPYRGEEGEIEEQMQIIERAQDNIRLLRLKKGRKAIEKLAQAKGPSDQESVIRSYADELEAIILAKYRPALIIKRGHKLEKDIERLGTLEDGKSKWSEVLASVSHANFDAASGWGGVLWAARQVGRIETGSMSPSWLGTGFRITKDLVLTNRHVLTEQDFCWHDDNGQVQKRGSPYVEFEALYLESLPKNAVEFDTVPYLAKPGHHDIGVVHLDVETAPQDYATSTPLTLYPDPISEDTLKGRLVYVLGHPYLDTRDPADEMDLVFRGVFGVKRVMPGRLNMEKPVGERDNLPVLQHDCSTLGGASGSCVIDLGPADPKEPKGPSYGKVIGLHFAGLYKISNYAVPSWEVVKVLKGKGLF